MYEDQAFDVILQRMLSRVPETMDKRESSPIYAACLLYTSDAADDL